MITELISDPSEVIFRTFPVSEIPGTCRDSQSYDADFARVNSPSGFARILILVEKKSVRNARGNIRGRTGYHV